MGTGKGEEHEASGQGNPAELAGQTARSRETKNPGPRGTNFGCLITVHLSTPCFGVAMEPDTTKTFSN